MTREVATLLRGVHVLVLCDDTERCELFKQAIEYCGAFTTAVESTARALRVMERLQVNALVVDLPSADRLACIAMVRAAPPEVGGAVPALALSGVFEDREPLLAAGFQEHLTMPVRGAELCAMLATLLKTTPR
jgi:CheY-like chemotaxis protein